MIDGLYPSETEKASTLRAQNRVLNSSGAYRKLSDEARIKQSKQIKDAIKDGISDANPGIFLTKDDESLPVFGPEGAIERVISRIKKRGRHSGSRIVLTKDNYGHRGTGLGGMGGTMCEAIDIVAGSLTCEPKLHDGNTESRGNFISDGARIYLTERGDIQNYFALGPGDESTSQSSLLKSGIGMKADHTIVIGRERVRILAGLCQAEGRERLANMNTSVTPRIDIGRVYGIDGDFQPAVLGEALVNYLKEMNDRMTDIAEYAQGLEDRLLALKLDFASHFHSGAGVGYIQTFPDPKGLATVPKGVSDYFMNTTTKLVNEMNSYLKDAEALGIADGAIGPASDSGILSRCVYIGK